MVILRSRPQAQLDVKHARQGVVVAFDFRLVDSGKTGKLLATGFRAR
jgi:hypothetical protein